MENTDLSFSHIISWEILGWWVSNPRYCLSQYELIWFYTTSHTGIVVFSTTHFHIQCLVDLFCYMLLSNTIKEFIVGLIFLFSMRVNFNCQAVADMHWGKWGIIGLYNDVSPLGCKAKNLNQCIAADVLAPSHLQVISNHSNDCAEKQRPCLPD